MVTESTVSYKALFSLCQLHLGILVTYLGLNSESFSLLAVLLLLDYTTGILKARAIGESITSNRMKYGIVSKLSLLLIPIVLAIGAKATGADFKFVLLVGINMLVISEVYSIISNIYAIRTHQELPEYDVISILGKKIRTILLKYSEE
jgi:phage-related holin